MIRFDHVSKTYPGGTRAVEDFSLTVEQGSTTVFLGTSGCGKTTLMRMVNAMITPTSGRVFVRDQDVAGEDPVRLRRSIGYVLQEGGLFPHRSIADNVATVPRLEGATKQASRERALELLELVGLDREMADRYPAQLSGGQRQRVGIARALADNPAVLLCDEPTSALDTESTAQILSLLRHVRDVAGVTVVIITHEMAVVREICDSVTLLGHGQVLQTGPLEEVVSDPSTPLARELVPMPVVESVPTESADGRFEPNAVGTVLLDVVFTSHPGVPTGATVLHLASSMGADVTAGTFESLGSVQVGRLALTVPAYHADKIIEQLRKNNVHAEVRDQ